MWKARVASAIDAFPHTRHIAGKAQHPTSVGCKHHVGTNRRSLDSVHHRTRRVDRMQPRHAAFLAFLLTLPILLAACDTSEPSPDADTASTDTASTEATASGVPLADVHPDYTALGQPAADGTDPLLDALRAELQRSMATYSTATEPAYFIAYRSTDAHLLTLAAERGDLKTDTESRTRNLGVELRTGDHRRDSTHPLRSDGFSFGAMMGSNGSRLSLGDDAPLLRDQIWKATDSAYWQAVEDIAHVRGNVAVKVEEEDASDDFSREDAVTVIDPLAATPLDRFVWIDRIRQHSRRFDRDPQVLLSTVSLDVEQRVFRLVNTEGSVVRRNQGVYRLDIRAVTKADDGMELARSRRFLAATPEGLPDARTVDAAIDVLVDELAALRAAPLATAYEGPAILEAEAAGVFFHEVLGHRVEGDRLRREEDQQTFKNKLGQRVLPAGFRVDFDPTLREHDGRLLMGSYGVDDEGVQARPVNIIDDGILRGFLLSRRPIEGFARSNGHGRAQGVGRPVARQSNLVVRHDAPLAADAMRQKLLDGIAAQGKPWGLVIRSIDQGGYTVVGRAQISSFKVNPEMVYRLYPDGREELVRGVDLIGTPLTLFAEVDAADDRSDVFHGWCGAESGSVPTSIVSPSILLRRVEVQRKPKSQDRPPILPAPEVDA